MRVMVPLADGFEEIEAMTVINVLRKAGIAVDTVGVVGSIISSSSGVKVMVDKRLGQVKSDDYDAIILPGGKVGYSTLLKTTKLVEFLKDLHFSNKVVASIGASSAILAKSGILDNRKATISPGMEKELPYPRGDRVVVDGNIITAQGPSAALDFSLKLVEKLKGQEVAKNIRGSM